MRPTLYIVCQNPQCRRRKAVPTATDQRRRRYCSRRCVGLVHGGVAHLSPSQRLAAAEKSKASRRAAAMRRLAGLAPVAIYRLAFSVGWKAGVRAQQRRALSGGSPS